MTSQHSLPSRIFVGSVIALSVGLLAVGLTHATFHQPRLFLVLLVLATASATLKVTLPLVASDSTMSVSYAVLFAALLLLGPDDTMAMAAASAFCQCQLKARRPNPVYRTIFSMAVLIIAVQGAGFVYSWLRAMPSPDWSTSFARPLIGAAGTYFLLNTVLIASAIALESRQRIVTTWQANFLWSAPSYIVGTASAAASIWLMDRGGYWLAPAMLAPLYLAYRAYKLYMGRIETEQLHVLEASELHLATIEALARAIDAKDQTAHSHVWRVQLYATRLAEAAGMSQWELQGVTTAALLHDIGKLAVPEHILAKPGPLTPEEFQKIRIHPQIGAEIIGTVPFPYPVAPLILGHHERWDGHGYPQGLAGAAIPIGARILTIVDYYDAVTSERPYHKALGHKAAVELLKHESGRALDPELVEIFIEILPRLTVEAAALAPTPAATTPHQLSATGTTAAGLVAAGRTGAFEDIAIAHRELYALYEIAQTLGTSLGVSDTMALVSSKLAKLIPWSGCALFLQEGDDTLTCRYASGLDAPRLMHATISFDEGLAGWVARNGQTLVNADPRLAFEAAGVDAQTELKSALVCPLFVNKMLIGCLSLYDVEPQCYTEDHRRLIERIAEQAGAVLHNSIVFEQAQEDSLTDALTSLPNRRSLFAHLSRELARAERLKNEVAIVVMDVDAFKAINDSYGHHVGDAALREIAASLQASLRPYDLCVRYAGDEFIVVLPECSREAAEAKRVELQERVATIRVDVGGGRSIGLGASAGAAIYPHDGASPEALLADADASMYRNKAARRGESGFPPVSQFPTLVAMAEFEGPMG